MCVCVCVAYKGREGVEKWDVERWEGMSRGERRGGKEGKETLENVNYTLKGGGVWGGEQSK